MPPEPYEYQGRGGDPGLPARPRVAPGRALAAGPTRANGQPAFGCYLPRPDTDFARPNGMLVLTLAGSEISEITWFADCSVFPLFGLPRSYHARSTDTEEPT